MGPTWAPPFLFNFCVWMAYGATIFIIFPVSNCHISPHHTIFGFKDTNRIRCKIKGPRMNLFHMLCDPVRRGGQSCGSRAAWRAMGETASWANE